jgi:Flp pilus assembly pilin Flp
MEKVRNLPWRMVKSESGLTALEYALAAALVGVVIIASTIAVGINLTGSFATIATSIETSAGNAANGLGNGGGDGETASTGGSNPGGEKTGGEKTDSEKPGDDDTGGSSGLPGSDPDRIVSTGGGFSGTDSIGGGSDGSSTSEIAGDPRGDTACDPSGDTACVPPGDTAGDTASTGDASGGTGSVTSSLGRTSFGKTGFAGTGTSGRRSGATNTTGRSSGGTGTGSPFALASHDSTDGLGQSAKGSSAKGSSPVATGSGDGLANAGTSSPGGGSGSKEYPNEVAGTPYYGPNVTNLLILLAGFLALGVLIWFAFQRLRAGSKKNRQLDEWQKDKNKRADVRDLNLFRNDQPRAA